MHKPQLDYTVGEYLAVEETSPLRHEYLDGEILAMSGGSRRHNRIALNLNNALDQILGPRGCQTFVADVRLRIANDFYAYPDVMVVCGKAELSSDSQETITNPILLAEVLSKSTQRYDRGEKFTKYRAISSLRDYLLIDQYSMDVEHRWLEGDGWRNARYTNRDDEVRLTGAVASISLAAIYLRIDF